MRSLVGALEARIIDFEAGRQFLAAAKTAVTAGYQHIVLEINRAGSPEKSLSPAASGGLLNCFFGTTFSNNSRSLTARAPEA